MWKRYTVAIELPTQRVDVYARDEREACSTAAWLVGAAGLSEFGKARVVATARLADTSPRTGTAA